MFSAAATRGLGLGLVPRCKSLRVLSHFVLAINVAEKERKFFSNLDQNWGVQTPLCAVCMFSLPIDNKGKWEQNCTIGIKLMNLVPL